MGQVRRARQPIRRSIPQRRSEFGQAVIKSRLQWAHQTIQPFPVRSPTHACQYTDADMVSNVVPKKKQKS